MKREEIKKKIIDYINMFNHVTYVELQNLFDEIGYDYRGNLDIISEKCDHVLFWCNWNKETIELFSELQREGKIHKEPTQFFTYLIDGGGLQLPLVKKNVQYKTDHWLPIVFCKGPGVER